MKFLVISYKYLNHLCNVKVNNNLNLENRKLTYKPDEKEITNLIKNGYYFENFEENSSNNIIDEKQELIEEEEEEEEEEGEEDEISGQSNSEEEESNIHSDNITNSIRSYERNASNYESDSDRTEDIIQEDQSEEQNLEELHQKKEITRDIKILNKNIYGKTPNIFNVNENEIIIEENYLDIKNSMYNLNESMIVCILEYFEAKCIRENKFSPKLLIEYISIIKCLIANSNNNKVKDFVSKNISILCQIINILINPTQNFNLYSSEKFLLKNKIELALGGLFNLLPNLEQESQLLIKNSEEDNSSMNKDGKTLRKIYSSFITEDFDIIVLFLEPTKKIQIPIVNRCDLSELNFMHSCDEFSLRKIEVEVLNRKVYKSLLDKYKINGSIKEEVGNPEVNDKMIIITEDLIKEIGISDKDYFQSPKNVRILRKKNQSSLCENEEIEDKNKDNDLVKNDSDKNENGSSVSINEDNGDEKPIKGENEINQEENNYEEKENEEEEEMEKDEIEKEEKGMEEKNDNKDNDKKKDKVKNDYSKKALEEFESEKWDEFYNILDFKYQLGNCIFLVDNNLFYRFPKRFICYGIECCDINTKELDEEKLKEKIIESTKSISSNIPDFVISRIFDENKNVKDIQNINVNDFDEEKKEQNNENKKEDNNNLEKDEKEEKKEEMNNNINELFNNNDNLYEQICNTLKIKANEKNENIIDRNLELPLHFEDLYYASIKLFDFTNRFQSFKENDSNGLLNSEEYNIIKYFGVYLLKYYLTLLLIKEEQYNHLDLNDFKFMFYITHYYSTYFGLSEEHDIIKNGTYKFLDYILKNNNNNNRIPIKEFISKLINENVEIFNLETFLENITKFNEMIQEEFLIFNIEYLINNFVETDNKIEKNDEDKIEYLIINNLFNKMRIYYIENKLEKCLILFRIIYESVRIITNKINVKQKKDLLMNLFKEQRMIKFLLKIVESSKKKEQRTDFSIFTIEFLLNIFNIFFYNNINFNKTEIESIENIQDLINLSTDYEIINEKLNSKNIINKLIPEDEDLFNLITMKKYLPNLKIPKILNQSSYAIQFIEEKSDSYKLKIKNEKSYNNENEKFITSFIDIKKNEIGEIKTEEVEKEKKENIKINKEKDNFNLISEGRNYETIGNDIIIIHEPENKIKNIVIRDMKKAEEELKNQIKKIKNIFNFNDKTLVLIDSNNKFFSSGKWSSSSKDSDNFIMESRPELDQINSKDTIVYIGFNVVLTKTSLYFFENIIPKGLPFIEILFGGKVSKFTLPKFENGEVFIKALYKDNIILLTNKKNLYGYLTDTNINMIGNSEIHNKYALTQIKVPETLSLIDFVADSENLLYLGYDSKKETNLVYGNLNLDSFHFFSKKEEKNLQKNIYMKEIHFLSDKNITNIYISELNFVAFSKTEGKVYYLEKEKTKYGIRALKYFIKLNIFVKEVIQRGSSFFFIVDDKENNMKEENNNINNNSNLNANMNNSESEDNYIYFYRAQQNADLGKKVYYAGSFDISKLINEKDTKEVVKLKMPKMINLDEEYIKQNYLNKKTNFTIKIKNIFHNGKKIFLNFDYYQSFVNTKKVLEESNYTLKNEKLKFKAILKDSKEKLYNIELISKNDQADENDEYEQFLFQITIKEISSLSQKESEKYNNIIEENLKDDKCKYIYIFDLDENEINLRQIGDKKLLYINVLKEQIFQFIEYLPQIKKIIFELPKKINLEEKGDTYLMDNLSKIKSLFKNRFIVENNLNFTQLLVEKSNEDLLEMKMEISNEKIEQLFPEEHTNIKQKIISLLSSIDVNYLLEYQKVYPIYLKEIEEIKSKLNKNKSENKIELENSQDVKIKSFKEYMKEKYQFYDKFIKFYEQPEIIDIIINIVSEISKSVENILNHTSILFNTSLTQILFNNINFLSEKSRLNLFSSNLLKLKTSSIMPNIKINRILNLKMCNNNLIDKNLEWTLIAQLYKSPLGKQKGSTFFKKRAENLFRVYLKGEHAMDEGGPGREILSSSIEQLTSSNVDLFIPSPNNKSQTGLDRDKYIFNPLGAKNEKYLELYKFIGKLFGYIISSETYASISLSPIVYKQILGMQLEPSDIELIDIQSYKSIIKVLSSNNIEQKKELFGKIPFICQLPGGQIIELKEKGKDILVDETNYEEFFELYLKEMLNQGYMQAKAVQEGLFEVIPEYMIKFLTPSDLEKKICGDQHFNLALLKSMTIYTDYSQDDLTINYFWKFLEECSLEDKLNYIKFVWGRSRLPKDEKGFGDQKHEIMKNYDADFNGNNAHLPISHTCFFQLELPPYDNYSILTNKMLYAIRNSVLITDSDGNYQFDI